MGGWSGRLEAQHSRLPKDLPRVRYAAVVEEPLRLAKPGVVLGEAEDPRGEHEQHEDGRDAEQLVHEDTAVLGLGQVRAHVVEGVELERSGDRPVGPGGRQRVLEEVQPVVDGLGPNLRYIIRLRPSMFAGKEEKPK